jgi:predicted DNA-binding transcriptional regulator AlpA
MTDLPRLGTSNSSFTKNAPIQADTERQYVRANQIARSNRTQTPLIDISLATWWRWVKSGQAPQPIRLSRGTTVWRLREVIAFAEGQDVK